MYSYLYMFRVQTPIIRSIRYWVADGAVHGTIHTAPHTRPTQRLLRLPPIQKLGA